MLGSSKHPLGTSDFASFLLQAQNSKAKVIGLANAGGDTINAVKQAAEFGIQQGGQTMVAFLLFVNDVHGMGLKVAQGLQLLEAFYWDMDDDTRAFAKRFAARPGMNGKMPSGNQAGVYASTLAYLNAVAATGSDHAKDVVPQMKKFKGKDKLFGDVTIRQDGRVIHPMYLFEVKKPDESKYPYDYYKLVSTIPADQAFRPIADAAERIAPLLKALADPVRLRLMSLVASHLGGEACVCDLNDAFDLSSPRSPTISRCCTRPACSSGRSAASGCTTARAQPRCAGSPT